MAGTRVHAGLMLAARKQSGRTCSIELVDPPDEMVLPLNQHGGHFLRACVRPGDDVQLGQVIAESDNDLDAALHSPVSGRVIGIEPRASARPPSDATPCIIIRNDRREARHASCQPLLHWSSLPPLALCRHLAKGGVVGLGGAVFSTATKLAAHEQRTIDTLIINGVECEPYITCDDRLMRERADDILRGVQILLHASQATRALIGIEVDKPEAIAAMTSATQALGDDRIRIHPVPHAYPGGDEGQLIALLLGCEIPRGGLPADIGVVAQNVATAYACARWILAGQPLISRVVTIAGSGVGQPGNLEVRIGSTMTAVLSHCNGIKPEAIRLVMGGAMMGVALRDTHYPVTKATNCLIVATESELPTKPAEQPCIRCGDCMHACPIGLLPQQLLVHARQGHRTALEELGLRDCIECGCCDYVCPSHIRLASLFYRAKTRGAVTTP